jgi:DNA gyrase subunit A
MAKAKNTKNIKETEEIVYAPVQPQIITETIEKNYMPYVMSVIVSRAIPEIDGLKPSHRKLLYTMYKMGLLTGNRTKSANVVGQTMKLNPHGDMAIYETMVRLTRGNESLLHPFVDSKGSFGKQYSSNMSFARLSLVSSLPKERAMSFISSGNVSVLMLTPTPTTTQPKTEPSVRIPATFLSLM